jgi:hypothetical protein
VHRAEQRPYRLGRMARGIGFPKQAQALLVPE